MVFVCAFTIQDLKASFSEYQLPEILDFLDNNIWCMHHEEIVLSCIIFIIEELNLKSVYSLEENILHHSLFPSLTVHYTFML